MSTIGKKGSYSPHYRPFDVTPVRKISNTDKDRYQSAVHDPAASVLKGKPFSPSYSSPVMPIVTGVMKGLNIGQADLQWQGGERHWQCRLTNGPCAGLLIDAQGAEPEGISITLTPPDAYIRRVLTDALPDIQQAMSVYKIIDIRIADATYSE